MICYTVVTLSVIALAASEFEEDLNFKYKTLPRDEFIEYFNSKQFSFKITSYDHLEGKKYPNIASSGPDYQYKATNKDLPVKTYDGESLKDNPKKFGARQHWPHCETIGEIFDENNGPQKCSSSIAVSIAMTASDRICTYFNRTVRLSPEDFECTGQSVCEAQASMEDADYVVRVFHVFLKYDGLVTQECRAYNVSRLLRGRCIKHCDHWKGNFKKDKHYLLVSYALIKEESLLADLMKFGSIQATVTMYEDFIDYKSGIYDHKYGKAVGYQSVRVIGYGVENGVEYWLGANSWSSNWGEKGFFKIKRYQNEVNKTLPFEFSYGHIPDIRN